MTIIRAISWESGLPVATRWWINFRPTIGDSKDEFDIALEKWGATWHNRGTQGAYLEFNDEKQANWFVMRWS